MFRARSDCICSFLRLPHGILLYLRIWLLFCGLRSLHSVSVGAKPLSTGQCAPRRRLFLSQDAISCERKTPQSRKILRSAVLTVFKPAVHAAVCSRMPRQSCCKMEATSHLILPYRYFFSSSTLSSLSQGRSRSLRPK